MVGENEADGAPGRIWDEITDMAMLRSRLDEQSQLICLLKRRADEAALRCHNLEEMNGELQKKSDDEQSLLMAETKRAQQLEERFSLLSDNHQQMIRFKDEYKRQNEELRAECASLREQSYPELLAAERNYQELRAQLEAAAAQLSQQGARYQEELQRMLEDRQDKEQELGSLTHRLEESEETCRRVNEELSQLMELRKTEQKEAEKKVHELSKEKQDLLLLCMERGHSLQERHKEAAELRNHLQSAETARRDAEERYRRDLTAVDTDSRVLELNSRLRDSEKDLEQIRKEFEAYKKHSGELLAKERELNAKLRHLIG